MEGEGIEDLAQLGGDGLTHGDPGHVVSGVLLEMELAALPGDAWKASATSGLEAGVIVADDELGAVEATLLERTEEVAPVSLCLAQGDADAEDGSVPGDIDADGDQDSSIENHAIAADSA